MTMLLVVSGSNIFLQSLSELVSNFPDIMSLLAVRSTSGKSIYKPNTFLEFRKTVITVTA